MNHHLPLSILLLVPLSWPVNAADRIVAQTGDPAPGTAGRFSTFYVTVDGPKSPVLNNAGRIAFAATLMQDPGVVFASNDTGLWSDGGGALALIAREGSAAPGGPAGALFRRAADPVINSSGAVAFNGLLRENVAGVPGSPISRSTPVKSRSAAAFAARASMRQTKMAFGRRTEVRWN